MTCRVCFEEDNTLQNRLIKPCLCNGGQRYIHVQCLTKWRQRGERERKQCPTCLYKYKTSFWHQILTSPLLATVLTLILLLMGISILALFLDFAMLCFGALVRKGLWLRSMQVVQRVSMVAGMGILAFSYEVPILLDCLPLVEDWFWVQWFFSGIGMITTFFGIYRAVHIQTRRFTRDWVVELK